MRRAYCTWCWLLGEQGGGVQKLARLIKARGIMSAAREYMLGGQEV